jgi:hypothetical protein
MALRNRQAQRDIAQTVPAVSARAAPGDYGLVELEQLELEGLLI